MTRTTQHVQFRKGLMGFASVLALGACVQIAGIEEPVDGVGGTGNGGDGGEGWASSSSSTGSSSGGGGSGGGGSMVCMPGSTMSCYTGPVATLNVGQCKGGTQTCAPDGSGYGACQGEVLPVAEICNNAVDEDCDGAAPQGSDCLVSTDLVVRYFLDEADDGQGPTSAVDAAPVPLNLPITYGAGTQPNYTSSITGRGLEWTMADGPGVAKAPVGGTKVSSMLNGKQQVTLELVVAINAATPEFNRVMAIGGSSNDRLTLGVDMTPQFEMQFNETYRARWALTYGTRRVIHVVVDTTQANLSDRARMYFNGMIQGSTMSMLPQNITLNIDQNTYLSLGNRDTQGRSMNGILSYAALYARALTEAEIATNVSFLQSTDDK
ncbi:MAG: hypothetical protein IPM54_43920 [Polyangiaceae bacterium]|nr:hypothetical protein [Polyangiaceae bacterium]